VGSDFWLKKGQYWQLQVVFLRQFFTKKNEQAIKKFLFFYQQIDL